MDDQLKQLVFWVQQSPQDSDERQQALSQLIDRILQSRKICRPFQGRLLPGVYFDIMQAVKHQLHDEIGSTIDRYKPEKTPIRAWTNALLDNACKQVLNEFYLQRLALEVQQHAPPNAIREYAIKELLQALRLSDKLYRPGYGQISEDTYNDAVTRTLLFIYQNINTYDPYRGKFLGWVNYRLKMALVDIQHELKDPLIQAVDGRVIRLKYQLSALIRRTKADDVLSWLVLDIQGLISIRSASVIQFLIVLWLLSQLFVRQSQQADALLFEIARASIEQSSSRYEMIHEPAALENIVQPQEPPSISEMIREYIQSDPQQRCQKHVRNHPEASFQAIALARFDGKSWKELSELFEIDVPTLSNFFQRRLKELASEIRIYVQESLN